MDLEEGTRGISAPASRGMGAYVYVGEGGIIKGAVSADRGSRTCEMFAVSDCGIKFFHTGIRMGSRSMTVKVHWLTRDRMDRSLLRRIAVACSEDLSW